MAENKRHHYVPQFYLRLFSFDNKSIAVYSINENKIVSNTAPIKRQCYEDYLYSKDLIIEKNLSEIEGKAKEAFDRIINSGKMLQRTDEYYAVILIYILYQSHRTIAAIDQFNDTTDNLSKKILSEQPEAKQLFEEYGFTIDDLKKIKIGYEEPGSYLITLLTELFPLISDLDCKIIDNQSGRPFITSDNPVVMYNKYFLTDILNYTGLANKGLLIIFPLSPRYCLIFYDSMIYKIGGKKLSGTMITRSIQDIDELNILQTINSNKIIFPYNMNSSYINQLFDKGKKFREQNILKIIEAEVIDKKDNKIKKAHGYSRPKIMYNIKLSFLDINKKIPEWYLKKTVYRDPMLLSIHKEYSEKIHKGELLASDWDIFLKEKLKN